MKTQEVRQLCVILLLKKCVLFGIFSDKAAFGQAGVGKWREEIVFLMLSLSKNLYPDKVKFNNLTQDNYLDSNKTCKYSKD